MFSLVPLEGTFVCKELDNSFVDLRPLLLHPSSPPQLRLNLGSGECLLQSEEEGVHLGDLAWHSVEINHRRHNVTMTVDRNSHTSLLVPGPDLELRVEDGLFVGGAVALSNPHLLNISAGFRGCIDEVEFNGHKPLSSLRPYSGYKRVHEVSLGCSSQFSATNEDSVSFFSSRAFISLPPWEAQGEVAFECQLRPSARGEDGVILFSATKQEGFVAIEVKDGRVVVTVGNGEGSKTEVRSLTNVHGDLTWHRLRLQLTPHEVQLKVGEELVVDSLAVELQANQPTGPLLIGGLSEEARREARRGGLTLARGSFKGCVQEIRVNARKVGLPHAVVTKDIAVGCEEGQSTAVATADGPVERSEFELLTPDANDNMKNPNLLSLTKLEVAEGGRAALEPKHIKVG